MITKSLAHIFKLFLPSWSFFNDFSATPRLETRLVRDGDEFEWQPLYADHSTHSLWRVFFNPHGNAKLLEKTFIDRAVEELDSTAQSAKQFQSGDSYKVLLNIVRRQLIHPSPNDTFQFRLVMTNPIATDEILFTSATHSFNEDSR